MSDYTLKRLDEVHDSAPEFGFEAVGEARFAREALDAQDTGLAFHRLRPNARQGFGHVHEAAEEVYVVMAGGGRAKLGDEIVDLAARDALRVAATLPRAFEAGPDGMELLAVGPYTPKDGDLVHDFWPQD